MKTIINFLAKTGIIKDRYGVEGLRRDFIVIRLTTFRPRINLYRNCKIDKYTPDKFIHITKATLIRGRGEEKIGWVIWIRVKFLEERQLNSQTIS